MSKIPSLTRKFHAVSTAACRLVTKQYESCGFITSFLEKTKLLFAKIPPFAFSLQPSSKKDNLIVLRPGSQVGEWQLWKIPSKKNSSSPEETPPSTFKLFSKSASVDEVQEATAHRSAVNIEVDEEAGEPGKPEGRDEQGKASQFRKKPMEPVLLEAATPPPIASQKTNLLVGVPTRDLIAIPLWVASEGDLQELVMLELSSKHLLRRGMAEGLKTITLEVREERTLVIVLAPTTTPSVATTPYLKQADHFEAAARLLPTEDIDLLLWHELGEICFAFVKKNHCLWFSGSGEVEVNPFLIGLIKRMAFHLQAESVLDQVPRTMRTIGSFSIEERSLLQQGLRIAENSCEHLPTSPPPLIPTPLLDLPSEPAREGRALQEKRNRIKKIATLALLGYFFLIFLGAGNLIFKESIFKHFSHQLSAASNSIEKANHDLAQWQELRFAIDPTTYNLDILAAVASQIHGEKIRLISLADVDGRLQITGEATDVSQAYHFLELIKTAPELQEYEWASSQPKLAGKNSVRFETEGSLPHAKTSSE